MALKKLRPMTPGTRHRVAASFDDVTTKSKLYNAVDDVKNRFGKTMLQKARTVKLNAKK